MPELRSIADQVRRRKSLLLHATIAFALLLPGIACCGDVDYLKDIKPVLKNRCFACHGALKQKSGLRLDTIAAMRKGGEEGNILALDTLLLVKRVVNTDEHERMPPEGAPLSAEQIAKLKEWISGGCKGPADEQPEPDPRLHWAYQSPKRANGDIDSLMAARLSAKKLKPQAEAAPELWLRRAYLDLIGIPPTPEQIRAFQQAASTDATAARTQTVDTLLSSPQYGERWARHFMDIWRYCDWYGLDAELRQSQKHIWHWRDWIVESVNADKGYDRMIIEMLAADEETPENRDALRATGFLARNYYLFNRTTWLDDVIEHTNRAFLGVTMQCCKCHDHKYDPIEHTDYYRMRAIFEPYHVRLDAWPGETNFEKNGLPRAFDLHLDRATYRHIRGDDKNEDKAHPLTPGIPTVLSFAEFKVAPIALPAAAFAPGLQQFVIDDQLTAAEREISTAREALDRARKTLAELQHKQPGAKSPAATTTKTLAQDDFKAAKPDLWQTIKGDWRYADGVLRQHEVGLESRRIQLRANPPVDFAASLTFTIRGGEVYKSVGLAFDVDLDDDVNVYMSAFKGGSKVQVAMAKQGKSTYPSDGMQARAVLPNTKYQMEVQVRGQLVNVSVDGKPALAYNLPQARRPGSMQIIAFDADVEFCGFTLAELPTDAALRNPNEKAAATLTFADAEAGASNAEKVLAMAQAKPTMLRAIFAADQARAQKSAPANLKELIKAAAKTDASIKLIGAELELAKAQQGVSGAKKNEDAEKKVKAAETALEDAKKKVDSPGENYTSFHGSLKAPDGPEEKTNADVQRYPETSTGRRLAFARWVADARNPLTARVLVNHLWTRHFGASLVPDVSDFGRRCPPPAYQDVLDTLAVDFMEHGWSLKRLHKQMVLSRLYRTSSSIAGADAATLAADPDNTFLWRMNPRRLESQAIRDSLLFVVGKLDLHIGGPSIEVATESSNRRSLYYVQSANDEHRFLGAFDNASVLECYRRQESIVPQQALALANSKLSRECADALAARTAKVDENAFVDEAFLSLLGRPPTKEESKVCSESLATLSGLTQSKPDAQRTRALFLQALMSHNDFITLR